MSRPIKPPRGVFISSAILFNSDLSPTLRDTLLQVYALAWGSNGQYTPPISYPQLSQLTGKTPRTLSEHLTALRNHHAALRLQSAGSGLFVVHFAEWLLPVKATLPAKPEKAYAPDQKDDLRISEEPEGLPHGDSHSDQGGKKPVKTRKLPRELVEALRSAGVFPRLLAEVAESAYSDKELWALLAWSRNDFPNNAAAVFVGRMREQAQPPERCFDPPCPRCGKVGEHAPDCPRRALSGPYGTYLEH